MDRTFVLRKRAVKDFLISKNLKEVSAIYAVHPLTLKRWINRYQEGGFKNLKRRLTEKRHWKRLPEKIEKRVILIKEENPSLTLYHAQKKLESEGVKLSIKGIWSIWKRCGLAGFIKDKQSSTFSELVHQSHEADLLIEKADKSLKQGKIRKAADFLNQLPICTNKAILRKIDNKYLSLKRQAEKLEAVFGEIPFPKYYKWAKSVRKHLEQARLYYSSLKAGLAELFALGWMGKTDEQISLLRHLEKKMPKRTDVLLRLHLLVSQGVAWAKILETKRALSCVQRGKIILKKFPFTFFMEGIAMVYFAIGRYREAKIIIEKALVLSEKQSIKEGVERLKIHLSSLLSYEGDHKLSLKILREVEEIEKPVFKTKAFLIHARCLFLKGEIQKAGEFACKALETAKKEELGNSLHSSSFILASVYASLGEKKRALEIIQGVNSILEDLQMKRDLLCRRIIVEDFTQSIFRNLKAAKNARLMPHIQLAIYILNAKKTLRIKDYRKAFVYATSHGYAGLFRLLINFFPETVINLLNKGKSPGLPKAMLRLPVFQSAIPTYHIEFLGPLKVYKNEEPFQVKLFPKDTSLLIHLALCKRKKIALSEIYHNFWPRSIKPSKNLSHVLTRVKKIIALSSHLLYGQLGFLQWDCFFTTDWDYFLERLTQARALIRGEKWGFAKKEFLRAFSLFRGEPFKKMYDPWSEHMRRVVLNTLETEGLHFAKSCLEHKNKADAKKVLEKVLKIIPQSEEIEKMVGEYGGRSGNDL